MNNARLQVKIYPNPVNDVLLVESKRNVAKPIYYQLLDVAGRTILTGTSTKDKFEVNVAKLAKGIYTIRLFSGRDVLLTTEKIIVQ